MGGGVWLWGPGLSWDGYCVGAFIVFCFLFFIYIYILTNLTYPQDCWTVEQSHWCWWKRLEIQANIQGIHCIIKTTTGIKEGVSWWNLLFPGKKKEVVPFSLISSSLCILHLLIFHPSLYIFPPPVPQITPKHSEHNRLWRPQHTMYICLALHSGQRLQV